MTLAEHILFASVIQGIGLSIVYAFRRCPPRVVAWFCVLTILSVGVPWAYLGTWLGQLFDTTGVTASSVSLVRELRAAVAQPPDVAHDWELLAMGLWLLVAMFWLACTFSRARLTLRQWGKASKEGDALRRFAHSDYQGLLQRVDIRRLPGSSSAVTSGLWRPRIWIGDAIATPSQLRAALNHELTHVRLGDPCLALLLTILERVFWWSPLVWLLGGEARRQLEYDCDQRCKKLLGEREYKRSLAELSLMKAGVPAIPSALALQSRNGVIARMKRISESYAIRPAHIAIIGAFIGAAVLASTALAVDARTKPTIVECENEIPDAARWRMSINRDPDKGTLTLTLLDLDKPGSHDVPEGSGPYVRCLFNLLGIPDEHLSAEA